jgi:pyridinium-3,5-bisthiocarboxylic acid mononucleotide nickel chelatase
LNIAYFDTIGGIAGDMTLAAFIAAGFPLDELAGELRKLPLTGFELTAEHVRRNSIDAVHVDVVVTQQPHYHRHLADILSILEKSTLNSAVRDRAARIFTVLAEAEARVHNTTMEKVHFHEVGALDSIVDIVGTAICLEHFNIERLYSSPVRVGSAGTITTQHGVMPVPAPATVELLKDYPVQLTAVPMELTTPTGAAIIKALSAGVLEEEVIRIRAVGYGAGTREIESLPNFLRVVVGVLEEPYERDESVIIETNIDDMNPQLHPYIIECLLAAGAHDAYLTPIIMKKGRPGILLSTLTSRQRMQEAINVIFRETTSIGLRIHTVGRRKLPRQELTVPTSFGSVRVKAVEREGAVVLSAEYEECKRIAGERHLPLTAVMRQINEELHTRTQQNQGSIQ